MQVVFLYDLTRDELLKVIEIGFEKTGRHSAHIIVKDEKEAREIIEKAYSVLDTTLLFLVVPFDIWLKGRGFMTFMMKHGGPFGV